MTTKPPERVLYNGRVYIRANTVRNTTPTVLKIGTKISYFCADPSLDNEAEAWAAQQMRKKRNVYRDINNRIDFCLYSTDLNSKEKFETLLTKKFRHLRREPPNLVLLKVPEQATVEIKKPKTPDLENPAPVPPLEGVK